MLKNRYDALVLAAFGTGDVEEFNSTYTHIYHSISAVVDMPVIMRITSERIYKKLKGNAPVCYLGDVSTVLDRKAAKNALILPLLMANGNEYSKLASLCKDSQYTLLPPLLEHGCQQLARYICHKYQPKPDTRYILLGHGSRDSQAQFEKLSASLLSMGRADIVISLVHGAYESTDLHSGNIVVAPLMISAGHHIQEAYEEMEREFSSYGINACFDYNGLGRDVDFVQLFIDKLKKK